MQTSEQFSTRKMTIGFAVGAAILGALAGSALLAIAHGSAPDPWGTFEWSLSVVALFVFVTVCAGFGALVAWLMRLIFTGR